MRSNFSQFVTPQMRILSDDQIKEIHLATCEILERTGVSVQNEKAKELLHGAGAYIGRNHNVRIPSYLVDDAIRKAPKRVTLSNQEGKRVMFFEDHKVFFGTIVDCPDFVDPYTRERRSFVTSDSKYTGLVSDYLPNIDYVFAVGNGSDVPPHIQDRVCFRQMVLHTNKPIGFSCNEPDSLIDIIEMAAIVAGGYEQLKANPFIFHIQEQISPLIHDTKGIEELMVCAEKGIPVVNYPMPMAGATAPATPAGILAQTNAEVLSGLVIHQLTKPGAPYIYGGIPSIMDMKSTRFLYGAPELYVQNFGLAEIAHFYQLPVWGTAGCTDSKVVDQQAAMEIAFSCLMAGLSGANLVHDVGLMDHATTIDLQMYLLSNEAIGMVRKILEGIEVSEETIPLDVIHNVGPAGNYLLEDHTLKHYRNFWLPDIFDKTGIGKQEVTVPPIEERMNKKIRYIIENHKVHKDEDKMKQILELEKKWMV